MTRPSTRLGKGVARVGRVGRFVVVQRGWPLAESNAAPEGSKRVEAVAEGSAATGFEVMQSECGVMLQGCVKGFGPVGAGKMFAQDEGGGDDEDEALGKPEDGEDF